MKKIYFSTCTALVLSIGAQAQISKGSVLLGGSISSYRSKSENNTDESRNSGISVAPALGFVVQENQVIGFWAGFGHFKSKQENNQQEQKNSSYGAGIFFRRYLPLGKRFYLFGEAGAGYSQSKQKSVYGPNNAIIIQQKSIGLNLYPGITYAVNKRIHLETSINNLLNLSYNQSTTTNMNTGGQSKSKTNGLSFSANASMAAPVALGFRLVLGK